MIEEKSWKEFRESGLLWFVNTTLHIFGWSIVIEMVDGEIARAYPARVKFRGFSEEVNTDGYKKVSKYMKDNVIDLEEESKN